MGISTYSSSGVIILVVYGVFFFNTEAPATPFMTCHELTSYRRSELCRTLFVCASLCLVPHSEGLPTNSLPLNFRFRECHATRARQTSTVHTFHFDFKSDP